MLSKKLFPPLILIIIFFIYKLNNSENSDTYFIPLFIVSILLLAVYILARPIDIWWVTKYPPALSPQLDGFVRQTTPYYVLLNNQNQKRFHDRLSVFLLQKEFKNVGKNENTREDIKILIATQAIRMTFGLDDQTYLLKKYEHIVLYPHAFPTPALKFLHSVESNNDGVLIFDAERALASILQPNVYYNIVIHEFAHVFSILYPTKNFPTFDESIWEVFKNIRGFDKSFILLYTGLNEVSTIAVSVEHFFESPLLFKKYLPDIYDTYTKIFNQDPLNIENPILYTQHFRKNI